MRTTKPISTISFNSPQFLELKLNELYKTGILSFWAYIVHQPEDDEGGKKSHCHVFCEPSKIVQTDDLRNAFKEFDPENPEKPKSCIAFVSSKFSPWYLYALHDSRYLASKGQSRQYHYLYEDVVSSDFDDLLFRVRSIDMLSLSPYADMLDAMEHGVTWIQYFSRGTVPIQQVALFERAWYTLLSSRSRFGDCSRFADDYPVYEDGTPVYNGRMETFDHYRERLNNDPQTTEYLKNHPLFKDMLDVDSETGEVSDSMCPINDPHTND